MRPPRTPLPHVQARWTITWGNRNRTHVTPKMYPEHVFQGGWVTLCGQWINPHEPPGITLGEVGKSYVTCLVCERRLERMVKADARAEKEANWFLELVETTVLRHGGGS